MVFLLLSLNLNSLLAVLDKFFGFMQHIKLQKVLGHHRKKFEEEISAENLSE